MASLMNIQSSVYLPTFTIKINHSLMGMVSAPFVNNDDGVVDDCEKNGGVSFHRTPRSPVPPTMTWGVDFDEKT